MEQPSITLNSGYRLPLMGVGSYKLPPEVTQQVVEAALGLGYRHIDTARLYGNEAQVGAAIKAVGLPREELYVTTKLWNDAHRRQDAMQAFDQSLEWLGLDYVDLYLIHWPVPRQGLTVEAWRTLIEIHQTGLARSIGVSNFRAEDLAKIIKATSVVPVVNQIELHPAFQQSELRQIHAELGIATEAWSPLARGAALVLPEVRHVAQAVGHSPAQVIIRWLIQQGIAVFPKSAHPSRLAENLAVFDFELSDTQMATMAAVPQTGRAFSDPSVV